MPSAPGYVRNYAQEDRVRLAKPGERQKNRLRLKARRIMMKKGLVHRFDNKDVDHKRELSQGGSGGAGNLRVTLSSSNRSYRRTSKGAIMKKYAEGGTIQQAAEDIRSRKSRLNTAEEAMVRGEPDPANALPPREAPVVVPKGAPEPSMLQKFKKAIGFKKGGKIPGKGNKDSVQIKATPGEFMLKKSAVKRIGVKKLTAMNRGMLKPK